MKSFKDFQTESYSKLDEHWTLRLGSSVLGSNIADKAYDKRVDQSNKGLDLTKHKPRKGNNWLRTGANIVGSVAGWNSDKIIKPVLGGAWNLTKAALLKNTFK